MELNEFKQKNIKEHFELFQITEELELTADEMRYKYNCKSNENDFRRSKLPLFLTIFQYLLNNVMNQYNSIRVLCLEGYGQSGLVILRSILESLITFKYMISDEELKNVRAQRFEDYRWVQMKKMLNYWKMEDEVINYAIAKDILSKEDRVLEKVEEFKKTYDVKNDRELSTWSGISIFKMAKTANELVDYNLLYSTCCNFSHPSILGIQSNVIRNEKVTFYSPKPSFQYIDVNIKSSIDYFLEYLVMFDYFYSLGMKKKLDGYQLRAKKIFEASKEK